MRADKVENKNNRQYQEKHDLVIQKDLKTYKPLERIIKEKKRTQINSKMKKKIYN